MIGFVALCQNKQVLGPQQKGFSLEGWHGAFEAAQDKTVEARRLYEAGLWFHNRFELIRSIQSCFKLTLVSERQFKQYVVALLNRMIHEAHWLIEDKGNAQGFLAGEGFEVNGFESTITAGRLLLAYKGPFNAEPQQIGPIEQMAVESFVSLAVIYDDHQSYWLKCLWRGYFIDQTGEKDVQLTSDPEHERRRELAWGSAQLEHSKERNTKESWAELDQEDRDHGASVRLEVVAVERKGFSSTVRSDHRRENREKLPLLISMFMEVEEAHFKVLVDRPFKNHPSVTLRLLAEVYALLSSLARKLCEGLARTPWSSEQVPQHCPLMWQSQLIELLVQGLGISTAEAQHALSYLTHGGHERHDLWARPLVLLDKDMFALVLQPLIGVNPTWLLKNWMREGGLDIDHTGGAYEQQVRKELVHACHLKTAEVLQHSLVLDKGNNPEQIDLVIRIGNTFLIGEVKCTVFPTRPDEMTNYETRLDEAAEQALRKAERVSQNKRTLVRLFKGHLDTERPIELLPFILSNLAIGVGQHPRGVPVVDRLTLANYLNSRVNQRDTRSFTHPKALYGKPRRSISMHLRRKPESNIGDFLMTPASLKLNEDLVEEQVRDWFPLPNLKPAACQQFEMRQPSRRPKYDP
ncbi:MAG: hypothetical protein IPN38_16140 [Flavobacteriales bacterium]|nr:hypothetical protein [Flavobacteriales bacterium]